MSRWCDIKEEIPLVCRERNKGMDIREVRRITQDEEGQKRKARKEGKREEGWLRERHSLRIDILSRSYILSAVPI